MRWKVAALSLLTSATLLMAPVPPAVAAPPPALTETLTQVFTLLAAEHFTRPNAEALLQGAIEGMLESPGSEVRWRR